jgi:hypothetical protein
MALIKYSIGGQITSVVEADSIQEKEPTTTAVKFDKLAICNNCGIQHLVADEHTCTCDCGNTIRLN